MKNIICGIFILLVLPCLGQTLPTSSTCSINSSNNCYGPELIVNSDFNTGPSLAFPVVTTLAQSCGVCSPGPTGSYCLGNNAQLKCGLFYNVESPDGAPDNFMVIDGPMAPGVYSPWNQIGIPVSTGETYEFAFDYLPNAANPFSIPPPLLSVDLTPSVGSTVPLILTPESGMSEGVNNWNHYCVQWTATFTGTVSIGIQHIANWSVAGSNAGSDYGLDNISFRKLVEGNLTVTASTYSICPGESALIFVSSDIADAEFFIDGAPISSSGFVSVSPGVTTTYEIELISPSTGCTFTENIIIEVFEIPEITILDPGAFCACDEINLVATSTSGSTPVWTGTSTSTLTVSPCESTTYSATVVSPDGCFNSASIVVTPGIEPTAYFSETSVCLTDGTLPIPFMFDSPFDAMGYTIICPTCPVGSDPFDYNPVTGGIEITFDPQESGLGFHTIEICDSLVNGGCCAEVEIAVTPTPTFEIPSSMCITDSPYFLHPCTFPILGEDLLFSGDVDGIVIAPGGCPYYFDPELAGEGTHYLTACYLTETGDTCCKDFIVTIYDTTDVLTTLDETYCIGSGTSIVLGVDEPMSSGFSDYFSPFSGADPADPLSGYFTPAPYITPITSGPLTQWVFDPTGLAEGVYPITYNYTNPGGCVTSATGYITVCSPPDFDLNWDGCMLISADIHASTSLCGAPYSYVWDGPGITAVGTDFIEVNAIGLYSCTITNAAGCSTMQTVGVKCDPPEIIITNLTTCEIPTVLVADVTSNCPIVSTSWVGPLTSDTGLTFNFNAPIAGTYTFTATDALGCSNTVVYELEDPELNPVFDPVPPISLCTASGPIPITYTSDGTYCELYSSSAAFDPMTETFDPIMAGPGTYTISINCFEGNCTGSDELEIVVLEDLFWHQTSQMAADGDVFKDVVTDAEGNVYVTGSFIDFTTLMDELTGTPFDVNTATTGIHAAFIAKYDQCGSLLWVSQEEGLGAMENSEGVGIVLDELNGHVYVAGNFSQQMRLFDAQVNPLLGASPCSGSSGTILTGTGTVGFVARLSMEFGCVDMLGAVDPAPITELTSICINENYSTALAEIYVGGMVKPTMASGPVIGTQSFVRRFDMNPSSSVFPVENWDIMLTGNASSYQVVNEVDYDENLNRVWMIGTFERMIQFSHGGPSYGAAPANKAFVAGYNSLAFAPNYYWARMSTNGDNLNSSGEGISVDELTGNVYITGTYERNHSNVFGFAGTNWTNNNTFNAYHLAFRSYPIPPPTINWSYETDAGSGFDENAKGVDVSFINNEAHFVGSFTNDLVIENPVGPGISLPFTTVPYFNGEHIFTVTYNEAIAAPTNINATEDVDGGSDHGPHAITANANGKSFVVGSYQGRMGYQSGIPWSGDLVSSSVITDYNAFVMRVDRDMAGAYRSSYSGGSTENIEEINISENNLEISIYPNPTNGEFKLEIKTIDPLIPYEIELRSITGQLIWSEKVTQAQSKFDLTELEKGLYMIRISDGNTVITERIVKQ